MKSSTKNLIPTDYLRLSLFLAKYFVEKQKLEGDGDLRCCLMNSCMVDTAVDRFTDAVNYSVMVPIFQH